MVHAFASPFAYIADGQDTRICFCLKVHFRRGAVRDASGAWRGSLGFAVGFRVGAWRRLLRGVRGVAGLGVGLRFANSTYGARLAEQGRWIPALPPG